MEEEQKKPRIEVHGNYYDIHENTFIGGTHNFGSPSEENKKEEKPMNLSDESVKNAIELLMKGNTKNNKRWWFVPYRVLKDADKVKDLRGFEAYVNNLFNNRLPLDIDIHDLSKEVEAGCFAKPFKEWTAYHAPVGGATFEVYKKLVVTFITFLQEYKSPI